MWEVYRLVVRLRKSFLNSSIYKMDECLDDEVVVVVVAVVVVVVVVAVVVVVDSDHDLSGGLGPMSAAVVVAE